MPCKEFTNKNRGASSEPVTRRVLLVDDEQCIRDVVSRFLQMAGFEVICANDGREAIDMVNRQRPFDLVVTDLLMPRISGMDLIRYLKDVHPDLPILAISAAALYQREPKADLEEIRSATRLKTLPKPFTGPELIAAVEAILDLESPPRPGTGAQRPTVETR